MSNQDRNLESYPLFYEELSSSRERTIENTKKDAYGRSRGLSEDQLAKLSDDLNTPLKDPTETNPLQ